MRVRHTSGTVVDVPAKKAAKLVEGPWIYVDTPSVPVEALKVDPESDYTQKNLLPEKPSEAQQDAKNVFPTIPEMREWAIKNDIEGVKDKGKLPRHAIDAYLEAHKE